MALVRGPWLKLLFTSPPHNGRLQRRGVSLRLLVSVMAAVLGFACVTSAAADDFRFSSQRSLLLPDPFLKHRKPRRATVQASRPTPGLVIEAAKAVPDLQGEETQRFRPRVWGELDPRLLTLLAAIEKHFGQKVKISSGCRTPEHNRAVGGAPRSFHMSCMAADISLAGVSTARLRDFAMALPGRGGVGTYCSTPIVHVDVGPRRQWHWGCHRSWRLSDPFELN